MTFTGRNLVEGSLKLLGVLAVGENASANELADGLERANEMLDSWSAENLMIYAKVREEFSLSAGKDSYTIGTNGSPDFNTSRPVDYLSFGLEHDGGNTETPVKIISQGQYAGLRSKSVTSNIPFYVFIEGTWPNDTLKLYPVPSESNTLVIYSLKALSEFTKNADIDLPQGYKKALRYNLAVELAPEYGKAPSNEVLMGAIESKEIIKRKNQNLMLSVTDAPTHRRHYNIFTDE